MLMGEAFFSMSFHCFSFHFLFKASTGAAQTAVHCAAILRFDKKCLSLYFNIKVHKPVLLNSTACGTA